MELHKRLKKYYRSLLLYYIRRQDLYTFRSGKTNDMKAALFIIILFPFISKGQMVNTVAPLQVTGTQLSNSKGESVSLYGMSFGWSCFHPRFYTKGAVQWLKDDWKVNVVRAAMGVEHEDGYLRLSLIHI